MRRSTRVAVALAALLLAALYVLPLWSIELQAPQYPEGLGLRIWIDGITGRKPQDLASINNLNHYIGMRPIEPDDIPELRVMPWVVAALIVAGLGVAAVGRRGPLYVWAGALVIGAVAGLADFWKWGYEYGHNLSPDAIITIPGMSYQPPLIGGKRLLNFHAASWPALGGWLAIAGGAIAVAGAVLEWRRARAVAAGLVTLAVAACAAPAPRRIVSGEDTCAHCRMTIADRRLGAQLVTRAGKVYAFDDIGCLLAFTRSGEVADAEVHGIWVNDFAAPDSLLDVTRAAFLHAPEVPTPMASHLLATAPGVRADSLRQALNATAMKWDELRAADGKPAGKGMPAGRAMPARLASATGPAAGATETP